MLCDASIVVMPVFLGSLLMPIYNVPMFQCKLSLMVIQLPSFSEVYCVSLSCPRG